MLKQEKTPKFYTIDDFMDMFSVGRATVYHLINTRKLKAVRIGRQYRITQEHLDEFITNQTVNDAEKLKLYKR